MAKSPLLLGKRSRLHGQKIVLASFHIYSGVNYDISWRQYNEVLTPTYMAGHGMKRFWPQAQSSLATGGFEVGHMRDRSFAGEEIDFAGRRNGLAPTTERSRVLSPRAVSLHPPKDPRGQAPGRTSFLPRFRHVLRRYLPCVRASPSSPPPSPRTNMSEW